MSWTIDKVAIVDSFGKTMSVCKKGLTLESGRSVYLPLYPGECNIPLDVDNSTSSSSVPSQDHAVDEKKQLPKQQQQPQQQQPQQQQSQQQQQQHQSGGIGPFTKEHNYEMKDGYFMEAPPADKNAQRRGLGPFTKEQNLHIPSDEDTSFSATSTFEDATNRRGSVATNPWVVLDISNDGDSNSLENTEMERGRGFSGDTNLIYRTSTQVAEHVVETTTGATTTEYLPEIREPVLRPSKKESGRSLKLPEITEPILRPRSTRQNTRDEAVPDEIQETSSTSTRSFTVQFLPERLAEILAQAERYARQTLLPLISQYTPSFVTGLRHEEPKYFPILSDILRSRSSSAEANKTATGRQRNGQVARTNISRRKSDESSSSSNAQVDNGESDYTVSRAEMPVVVEVVYPEKTAASDNLTTLETRSGSTETHREDSDWRPMSEPTTMSSEDVPSRRYLNASRALDWSVEYSQGWTSKMPDSQVQPAKTDDWVPITVKSDVTTARGEETASEETPVSRETEVVETKSVEGEVHVEADERPTTYASTYDRKFIPLVDLEETSRPPPSSTDFNDIPESLSSTTTVATHIQKIPRYKDARAKSGRTLVRSTMMFPYAYERRNDPRTRYIPLIPEEEMGKPYSLMEGDR